MQALVSVRALDNAYKGLGNNLTYNSSHVEFFANDIISYATQYRVSAHTEQSLHAA